MDTKLIAVTIILLALVGIATGAGQILAPPAPNPGHAFNELAGNSLYFNNNDGKWPFAYITLNGATGDPIYGERKNELGIINEAPDGGVFIIAGGNKDGDPTIMNGDDIDFAISDAGDAWFYKLLYIQNNENPKSVAIGMSKASVTPDRPNEFFISNNNPDGGMLFTAGGDEGDGWSEADIDFWIKNDAIYVNEKLCFGLPVASGGTPSCISDWNSSPGAPGEPGSDTLATLGSSCSPGWVAKWQGSDGGENRWMCAPDATATAGTAPTLLEVLSAMDESEPPVNIGADASAFQGDIMIGGGILSNSVLSVTGVADFEDYTTTVGAHSVIVTNTRTNELSYMSSTKVQTNALCLTDDSGNETCITPEVWEEVASTTPQDSINITELTIEDSIKFPVLQARYTCNATSCNKVQNVGLGEDKIYAYSKTTILLGDYLFLACPEVSGVQYMPMNGGAVCAPGKPLITSRPMVFGDSISGLTGNWTKIPGGSEAMDDKDKYNLWVVSCGQLENIHAASVTCIPLQLNVYEIPVVTGLQADGKYKLVEVRWNAVTVQGESVTYDLYEGNELLVNTSVTRYTHRGLGDNTRHTYKVIARVGNRISDGGPSIIATTNARIVNTKRSTSYAATHFKENTCGTRFLRDSSCSRDIGFQLVKENITKGVKCTVNRLLCLGVTCPNESTVSATVVCSDDDNDP